MSGEKNYIDLHIKTDNFHFLSFTVFFHFNLAFARALVGFHQGLVGNLYMGLLIKTDSFIFALYWLIHASKAFEHTPTHLG